MHWAFFETFIQSGTLAVIAPNGELRDFGKGNPNAAIEFSDPGCLAEILRMRRARTGYRGYCAHSYHR